MFLNEVRDFSYEGSWQNLVPTQHYIQWAVLRAVKWTACVGEHRHPSSARI